MGFVVEKPLDFFAQKLQNFVIYVRKNCGIDIGKILLYDPAYVLYGIQKKAGIFEEALKDPTDTSLRTLLSEFNIDVHPDVKLEHSVRAHLWLYLEFFSEISQKILSHGGHGLRVTGEGSGSSGTPATTIPSIKEEDDGIKEEERSVS